MPGNAQQTRPAVFRRTEIGVGSATLQEDVRDGRVGLDIVQYGGALERADLRRERRFEARIAALAFERFQQRGLLPALVRARARLRREIEIHAAALNVRAQPTVLVGRVQNLIQMLDEVTVFAANVDPAALGADGAGGNQAALDQPERIVLHDDAVLAGAGLGLVGVDHDILRFG